MDTIYTINSRKSYKETKYSQNVTRKTLVKIYFAFISLGLKYSDVVWDNCTEKDSILLEDVQVEAGRIITGL